MIRGPDALAAGTDVAVVQRDLAAHELPAATRLSLARQAMAQTWPGFDVTEGSERPRLPLVVVDYDPDYVPPLQAIGLVLRTRDELHRYFRPPADQLRTVHVHVCAAGGQWEHDHLLFRDYLRAHPAACLRYAEAKRAAVRRWGDDGWAYTEAKTGVILDILE